MMMPSHQPTPRQLYRTVRRGRAQRRTRLRRRGAARPTSVCTTACGHWLVAAGAARPSLCAWATLCGHWLVAARASLCLPSRYSPSGVPNSSADCAGVAACRKPSGMVNGKPVLSLALGSRFFFLA
eukprot:7296583-Prymnesium_polylepis.1